MLNSKGGKKRALKLVEFNTELAIVGGGLPGVCAAITAARQGLKVVLVQDRPVLGGNASSEVRLWVLGSTSHMGNNNRWAREGGVIDELLVENMYRNPEGNPLIFDTVILEKVISEKNITLLLNTSVYDADVIEHKIRSVTGFCSQNSTTYRVLAPIFCDASGDGILGFLAGAAFRQGAESREEFGEKFAPRAAYGELLGHSIYFYTKDTGKPVKFVPPSYALTDITQIPRHRNFKVGEEGCRLWWLEYGGRLDTVHETETIKWELWKVVYGVWNYIKNSGRFPEAATLTLEWVGTIPGKRESRRFEGDYMMRQQDVVEQRIHYDAVAFGGWSLDLHPSDGVYSDLPGCNQWHSKGVYQVPFRSLYSRNISNLLLAGRIISASHVAFASTRVMATCAHAAQAVGLAAVLCVHGNLSPRQLSEPVNITRLQRELLKTGQYIPELNLRDPLDLAQSAIVSSAGDFTLRQLPFDGPWIPLTISAAQMVPFNGVLPQTTVLVSASRDTMLEVTLRISSKPGNHTPDVILRQRSYALKAGEQRLVLEFDPSGEVDQYAFICFLKNEAVSLKGSNLRLSGILSVFNGSNKAVSNNGKQEPTEDYGVDTFEFWCPQRRPAGHNIGMEFSAPVHRFAASNVVSGIGRPVNAPNAWIAAYEETPRLSFEWAAPQIINKISILFDADFDHPMESSLMGHPENIMPFCVREYELLDEHGNMILHEKDNHQAFNEIVPGQPVTTSRLTLKMCHPQANVPAAVFKVRCYGSPA
ncbi:FAD-dependent oxidoreductase [Hufsiella ginkgonis]|uniref:FAD-dependent oxidoreductase n=1 Tax=Hufsiella ginkgonis TaxID=2695274 RepID=A0A7K1Y4F8_9SPHI|nr:FAD-dependent oxidoreductase [Hufsiella ginkgonis]MXV17747.1 FAD-dependent oxidoreductase [Hufsiella ginkgonis]